MECFSINIKWRTGLSAMSSLLLHFLRIWDKCLCSYSRRVQGLRVVPTVIVWICNTLLLNAPERALSLLRVWIVSGPVTRNLTLSSSTKWFICNWKFPRWCLPQTWEQKDPGWGIQAHKEKDQRDFCWIIEKNHALIVGNASFRPVLLLHEFSLIHIFATNTRIY